MGAIEGIAPKHLSEAIQYRTLEPLLLGLGGLISVGLTGQAGILSSVFPSAVN
jgi:hypothetical protein